MVIHGDNGYYIPICMGVSIVMRVPQVSWMVYKKNPNLKWMMTRGTPIYGNPNIFFVQLCLVFEWWLDINYMVMSLI